jgi:ABC-type multidrug transport system fused ATPase/permease subunit
MANSNKSSLTPTKWRTEDVESGADSVSGPPSRSRRSSAAPQEEEVSPAGTFDTGITSPSTFDGSVTPQKISFEHHVKTTPSGGARGAGGAGLILGMSKPALGIATLLFLGAGGAAAFGWFQIPGLNSQIKELEEQVALLSVEIDRLAVENDRYAKLNNKLNQTVEEFRDLNQDLNTTVIELEAIKDEINTTQLELVERVQELTAENEEYARLNVKLNTTAATLAQEVDFFETALNKLVLENGNLSNLTEALQVVTDEVGNITEAQNETLTGLFSVYGGLRSENDRLEALNNNLTTVVSYLNDTSVGLGNTLQQITDFLASQIVANQVLVTETLENTYRQKVQAWDCDYRDNFRDKAFGQNFSAVISDVSSVMDYVDQRILSELCLEKSDFEDYVSVRYPDGLTSFRLVQGVGNYTSAALDYYFPESGEVGITPEEWNAASYSCENLENGYSWRSDNNAVVL